jgi:hypothetical protein
MKNKAIDTLKTSIQEKLAQARKLQEQNQEISALMDEIWKLSKKKFVLSTKQNKDLKQYKGIIFTVGLTAEPIILNILATQPEAVYFIHTKKSVEIVNRIVEETELVPAQYKRDLIHKDSLASSYKLIKFGLSTLTNEYGLKASESALDPTGGTKIMSLGCGVAASIFNIDLLYVSNNNYDPILRRPVPGSEILKQIPNPLDVCKRDIDYEKFKNALASKLAKKSASSKEDFYKNQEKDKSEDRSKNLYS